MKKIHKLLISYMTLSTIILLQACNTPVEEEPIIMVDSTEEEIVYNMDEITTGEVLLTKNITCKYVQTNEQQVSFPVGGKVVDKVYVRVGDYVEVGDLLVELDSGAIEDEIYELEYNISRNEIEKSHIARAEELDNQSAYYSYYYESEQEDEDLEDYNEELYKIGERYKYQREDYEDNLEFDRKKLAQLKSEYNGNRITATMAGKVYYIKTGLEGSIAKKDDVIMTIVDNDNGLFEIEEAEAEKLFTEGESVSMDVIYGNAKGEYELVPYNMADWGERQLFEVVVAPESATLEVGVSGTIVAITDKRENVTRIPIKALYEADGKYYTYVLNNDNMREPKYIEIGLVGDKYAEVISGIEVGMKVVRR